MIALRMSRRLRMRDGKRKRASEQPRAAGAGDDIDPRIYTARPRRLRPGNQVLPLRGGSEAYPAMLDAIARARDSVCLETYILNDDAVGERFAHALCERARAGVTVRLIYDAIGCIALPRSFLRPLAGAGVALLEYHPIAPWRERFMLSRRDHRKILVVDDRVAFTGGLNIGCEYIPESEGGEGWHDMHCRIVGPVVQDFARLFRRVWIREGGRPYPVPRPGAQPLPGGSLARVLDNSKMRRRWSIRRAYLRAINRAVRSITVMNAYFLPDHGICAALRRAVRRGVRVRIIVPDVSDVPVVAYASRYLSAKLVRDGVEILCWPERMMHAKTAVVDSVWATIGSYNLDTRSLHYNLEVGIEVVDPAFGAEMDAQFEADARRCLPMSIDAWERRPRLDRFLSWMFYQLRHQL
jgi:cardiolipin synthase A/B